MEPEKKLRPWELLPQPAPSTGFDPGPKWFYSNFVQPMISDMIKMMCTGLHIDSSAVDSLRLTIDDVLSSVDGLLLRNPIIQKYQAQRAIVGQKVHFAKCTAAVKTVDHFYREYNNSVIHRTWVVNTYLRSIGADVDVKDSWTVKDLKNYNSYKSDSVLARIIDKSIAKDSSVLVDGMNALAEFKMELYNRPRYDKGNAKAVLEPFNPGSAKQLQELFIMLKIEPMAVSDKTGNGSWGREYIELLLEHSDGTDKELDEILQCIIDHSFSGIIKSTFIKAFDTFTIDNVLHGNLKLLGAKTARNTSNSPNLLNLPSTKSIYSKPTKSCLVAPKDKLVIQCDYTGLEDVILANISGDEGKIGILTDPTLDGHCYNGMGYFTEELEAILGTDGTFKDKVRRFKVGIKEGNKELKNIRQAGKPHTFGLAYGKFPDEQKGGKITQSIFDNFHNVLYPGVTRFREEYVLPTAREKGYIHCGLGFRLYTDDPDKNIRTITNSCSQFWSILTLISINEINYRIVEAGYENDIQLCATIYDSIYAYITPDPEIVQWYNNNIYEIGGKDFMEDQVVPNVLTCSIGKNFNEDQDIPVDASVEEIQEILIKIEEDNE